MSGRALHEDTRTAILASEGYAGLFYLLEASFDAGVADAGGGVPDTLVEWTMSPAGDAGALLIEVSYDGGKTWLVCANGQPLPGLAVGDLVFGRQLLVRQSFFPNVNAFGVVTPPTVQSAAIQAIAASQTFTLPSTSTLMRQAQVGDDVLSSGWTKAENNGRFRITARTDNTITVRGETRLVDEGPGPTVTLRLQRTARPAFPRLESLRVRLVLDDGTTVDRTESDTADWTAGSLRGAEVVTLNGVDMVRAAPHLGLNWSPIAKLENFAGAPGVAVRTDTTRLGLPQGMLSIKPEAGGAFDIPYLWFTPNFFIDQHLNVGCVVRLDRVDVEQVIWDAAAEREMNFALVVGGGGGGGGGGAPGVGLGSTDADFSLRLKVDSSGYYLRVQAFDTVLDGPVNFPNLPGTPHFVLVRYDGQLLTLHVDEQPVATRVLPHRATRSGLLTIGGDFRGRLPLFGAVTDLRFWKGSISLGRINDLSRRPLTTAEVTALEAKHVPKTDDLLDALGAVPGAQEGVLVAYYRMTENGGDQVLDSTRNTNHAKIVSPGNGSTLTWADIGPWSGRRTPVGPVAVRLSPAIDLGVTTTPFRATNAPFNIVWDGKTFAGVGQIGSVSPISENSELESRRVELELNGVPNASFENANIAIAVGNTHVIDRPVRIWGVLLNVETQQIAGDPIEVFRGRMDHMPIELGGDTVSIKLVCENYLLDWDRTALLRWNHQSQQARFPGDLAFEFTAELGERPIWWPGDPDLFPARE